MHQNLNCYSAQPWEGLDPVYSGAVIQLSSFKSQKDLCMGQGHLCLKFPCAMILSSLFSSSIARPWWWPLQCTFKDFLARHYKTLVIAFHVRRSRRTKGPSEFFAFISFEYNSSWQFQPELSKQSQFANHSVSLSVSQAELAPPGISQKNSKTGHLDYQDGAGPQSPIWKAVGSEPALWSNAWKFESWWLHWLM